MATEPEEDTNMGTMPIPALCEALRTQVPHSNPILALTLGVLAGRLMREYERAEKLQGENERYEDILQNAIKIREALEEKIDNCEYQRCPCR